MGWKARAIAIGVAWALTAKGLAQLETPPVPVGHVSNVPANPNDVANRPTTASLREVGLAQAETPPLPAELQQPVHFASGPAVPTGDSPPFDPFGDSLAPPEPAVQPAAASQVVPDSGQPAAAEPTSIEPPVSEPLPSYQSQAEPPAPLLGDMPSAVPESGTEASSGLDWRLESWMSPERFKSSASTFALIGILSLAPAVLLMTTSFVRLAIVFSLLRQAIGAQVLPSNQILTTLAMFLTVCIMWPTWSEVYEGTIVPYTDGTGQLSAEQAWHQGMVPIRKFMSDQIELAGNADNVMLFYDTLPYLTELPESYDSVPIRVLLPAYLLSELKVAFLLGFQIYLPFIVIDVLVSAVTASMGMLMLPPMSISLPLKLIVFVIVDGWNLLAGTLITSFMVPGS